MKMTGWWAAVALVLQVACGEARHPAAGPAGPAATASAPSGGESAAGFRRVVVDAAMHGDCKAIGDMDGDGRPDLVVGGREMVWYRNPGWERHLIATARVEFTTDCQVVDLNGDGRLDVVTGDGRDADNVVWFENRGNANVVDRWLERLFGRSPWTRRTIGRHGNWVHDIEVGDLDGNGRIDVVTQGHGTRIWYQLPDGSGWALRDLSAWSKTKEGLGMGDIDGDGRLDLVQGGWWLENPGGREEPWKAHPFATGYDGGSYTAAVADLDGDTRPDIVLAEAHQRRELAWFSAPADPRRGPWVKHVLAADMGAHKLNVADMDGDGLPDVVAALELAELRVYRNRGGPRPTFEPRVINTTGCHNARVADVNVDGSVDILCANYLDHPPVELWLNGPAVPRALDRWLPIVVDDARQTRVSGRPAFGLAFGDLDGDRRVDIVSGRYLYLNPGDDLAAKWRRVVFPVDVDAMLVFDVDGDGQLDVIGQDLPDLVWLRRDRQTGHWQARTVAQLPATEHGNGQGYRLARIDPGALRPAFIFTTGDGIWAVRVPEKPESSDWPRERIAAGTSEDLLAVGDVDGDGLEDVVAASAADGQSIGWYRNPGRRQAPWRRYELGRVTDWADRAELVDLDGDGRRDLVVSVENGKADGAATYGFRAPRHPERGPWERHTIAVQGSTNSLSVVDMDGDGTPEVITAEHRGALRLRIWRRGSGAQPWSATLVDQGRENHLGARVVDLDADGDPDLVGIGYDAPQWLYIWRNDGRRGATASR